MCWAWPWRGWARRSGRSVRRATRVMSPDGPSRVWGSGDHVAVGAAAFANAAFAQALEYDDTHNESIVHMSSPAVAMALALAETRTVSGRDLILAIALANEIACRVGSVVPGQFHRRGFHPTGLFAPFGIAIGAGRLLGLTSAGDDLGRRHGRQPGRRAAGMLGGRHADQVPALGLRRAERHSRRDARAGRRHGAAAGPGRTVRPVRVASAGRVGDAGVRASGGRAGRALGEPQRQLQAVPRGARPAPLHRPDPAAARAARHPADDVQSIDCPVAEFNVSIVCEPVEEKVAPATEAHGRVCLQFTLAEALVRGELGRSAYSEEARHDPEILALARRVTYHVDPAFPPPGQFKGAVRVDAEGRARLRRSGGVQPRIGPEPDDGGRAARQVPRQRQRRAAGGSADAPR